MKIFQSSSILLGIVANLLIPEPSFSKETWLKCVEEIDQEGKEIQIAPNQPYHLVKLDDSNERYVVLFQEAKGQATFFETAIAFNFVKHEIAYDWIINRENLKFSYTLKLVGGSAPASLWKGSCKIIPSPSGGKNIV